MEKELMNETIEKMWSDYLRFIGEEKETTDKVYTAWSFGSTEGVANELAELVLKGDKRATTSLYYWYGVEGEDLPKVGDLSIILDGENIAKCIIETKTVNIMPFSDVTKEFAYKEGEGDKSLVYWRRVHIHYFQKELEEINKKFTEDMLVVCEEFQVIFQA